MRILMTGATGFVGKELGKELVRRGHEVVALVRDLGRARSELPFPARLFRWDGQSELGAEAVEGVDAVVHLAGESVAGRRWTKERKQQLRDSRISTSKKLAQAVVAHGAQTKVFISASAIGIYGDRGDEVLSEDSVDGDGFLARLCREWEQAPGVLPTSIRQVQLRIGLVLGHGAGVLEEVVPIYRRGVGGVLGSGRQWQSWIHIKDLVGVFLLALEREDLSGPINAVAPEPIRQEEFASELGLALHRPTLVHTPALMLKVLFGEMAAILLSSQRVSCHRLLAHGFSFQFKSLSAALNDLLGMLQAGESLLIREQWFPFGREILWPFFTSEQNLERITPPWLAFKVLGKSTPQIGAGTTIDYQLKLHGIPLKWRTEIVDWVEARKFVDQQLKGPYKKWHHTHEFEDLGGGTLMRDQVIYKPPMGWLGDVATGWYVARDVARIFAFRRQVLAELFSVREASGN